jgi:integrase
MRGDGRIFQRGSQWWVAFYVKGKEHRLPAGTEDDAKRLLKSKRREVASDRFVAPKDEKRTVTELLDSYEQDLLQRGAKSMDSFAAQRLAVGDALGDRRAVTITSDDIRDFQKARLAEGKKPATVNRDVETLRAALKLAWKEGKLARLPYFPMLAEDNVRRGFTEAEQFEVVEKHLPDPVNDSTRLAWLLAWRKGEAVELGFDQIDMKAGEIRLFDTKNGRGRVVGFDPKDPDDEVGKLLRKRLALRAYETKDGTALSRYVFHKRGKPVFDFRKSWQKACVAAGLGRIIEDETLKTGRRYIGLKFHDLRRSGIRDMIRAGVPRTIARGISGHRSDAIFDRYDIVDTRDTTLALATTRKYRRAGEHGQDTTRGGVG